MYGKEITGAALARAGKFTVTLASVGNIDFGQDPGKPLPGVANSTAWANSLQEASETCRKFIADNGLGGGNWAGGDVHEGGELVARVSYNGRVWKAAR